MAEQEFDEIETFDTEFNTDEESDEIETFDDDIETLDDEDVDSRKGEKVSQSDLIDEVEEEEEEEEEEEANEEEEYDEEEDSESELEEADEEVAPDDASYEVKVDGEKQQVTLRDLKDNYSGKVAYDKKFNEIARDRRSFDKERTESEAKIKNVDGHIGKILDYMRDEKAHPMEAMRYLLDSTGMNSVQFEKRMMHQMADEFDQYLDMSDTEKELHWQKKENAFLQKSMDRESQSEKARQSVAEQSHELDQLKKDARIDDATYSGAYEDLLDLGVEEKDLSPSDVIEFIQVRPLYEDVNELAGDFKEELYQETYDAMVHKAVGIMQTAGIEPDRALITAAESLGIELEYDDEDADIEELQGKLPRQSEITGKTQKRQRETEEIESFDDFDF